MTTKTRFWRQKSTAEANNQKILDVLKKYSKTRRIMPGYRALALEAGLSYMTALHALRRLTAQGVCVKADGRYFLA
ncbi:selenocysteine-specific elongation factor [Caudoviricetes sp.]|nr:selenocysteine-specific elongation factor [Caudoviricetes sp.]